MTGADLVFDATDHTYWTPPGRTGGQLVPNVTTVLRAVGVSADFEHIERGTLEFRRQLGTAVHTDCHAFDDEDLQWATVDPRVVPYVEAWAAFREAKRLRPIQRERRVFHPTFHYCGTLDGIFVDGDGRLVLVDLKIGDPEDAAAHLQTAAYEAAYRAEFTTEWPLHARWSVRLQPELREPYRIAEYRDFHDYAKFQACLTVYAEQPARRRRIA